MKAFLETISNVVRPFKSDLEEVTLPTNIESTHNSAEIKDFLGLPNSCNTATTKNSISEENLHRKIHSRINSWFQWTCSKISIKIYDKEVQSSNKLLVLDIEDIMFSMDQQDVYFKIKAKVVGVCNNIC